jgi:hypothetical protein
MEDDKYESSGFGEPKDVEGECNAHLYIGDNFGDSHATMRCQLPKGHLDFHREEYGQGNVFYKSGVGVLWLEDQRDWDELPFGSPKGFFVG